MIFLNTSAFQKKKKESGKITLLYAPLYLNFWKGIFQSLAGDLNIPVPGWGNFDMDANIYTGHINVDTKVGYQLTPTNHLNIRPETLALLGQNPKFRAARSKILLDLQSQLPFLSKIRTERLD